MVPPETESPGAPSVGADDGNIASSNRLPVLAAEIRRAHADVQEAARTAAEYAIEAGHKLIEAKKLVNHGEWLPWLKEHCALAERTAQLYMKLARSGQAPSAVSVFGLKAAERALLARYGYYQPMFDGDEAGQRNWRLFALFLVRCCDWHPDGVRSHIDWIGRHGFHEVDEWLSEGFRWIRGWSPLTDEQRRDADQRDENLLVRWRIFESESAALTIEQIDAAYEAEAEKAGDLPPSMPENRKRRKSATVADSSSCRGRH